MGIVRKDRGKYVVGGLATFQDVEIQGRVINEDLERVSEALSGDLVFEALPETIDTEIAEQNDSYERVVTVRVVNGDGEVHRWFNGELDVSIGHSTANSGAATIDTTTLEMSAGVGSVTVTLADTWAVGDTNTLQVDEQPLLGYTIEAATSVETSIDT